MARMAETGKAKFNRSCCHSEKPSAPWPKNPKLGGSQAPQMKNCRNIMTQSLARVPNMSDLGGRTTSRKDNEPQSHRGHRGGVTARSASEGRNSNPRSRFGL